MDSLAEVRNTFQQRLLAALFKTREKGELIVKGGAAMKIHTQSARFTKDIDLDHDPHRGIPSLVKSVRKSIDQAFIGSGFKKLDVSEPKQTDTVARWKIHAEGPRGERFQLTLEVSRRHEINLDEIEASPLQMKGAPRVYVDVYKSDKLVEMKLHALLDENRIAPRDIYDLDLLIADGSRASASSLQSMHEKYGDLSEQMIKKMDAMPWAMFESQTLSVIPDELKERIDESEYGAMKDRILTEVMQWTAQLSQTPTQ